MLFFSDFFIKKINKKWKKIKFEEKLANKRRKIVRSVDEVKYYIRNRVSVRQQARRYFQAAIY